MKKKLIIIGVLVLSFAACTSSTEKKTITVTVGTYNYMGNNSLDVTIENSDVDPALAEKKTNEILENIYSFLDEKEYSYSLNNITGYRDSGSNSENKEYISRKNVFIQVSDETDNNELFTSLQELGATGIYLGQQSSNKESEGFQKLYDQARRDAEEIANTLDSHLGEVLTVKSYQESEIYEITFQIGM